MKKILLIELIALFSVTASHAATTVKCGKGLGKAQAVALQKQLKSGMIDRDGKGFAVFFRNADDAKVCAVIANDPSRTCTGYAPTILNKCKTGN